MFDNIGNSNTFHLFGWLTILYVVYKVVLWLYNFIVVHFTESTIDWSKYGKWALVTGATDGIGKCIARELAQRGKNIFLISRSIDKLEKVAKEIKTDFNVDTKILAFDFCNYDGKIESSPYDVIGDALKSMNIGIMVNNVGMSAGVKRFATEHSSPEKHWKLSTDIVHCNTTSRCKMMQLVLSGMVDRKEGLIINVSSQSSCFVCPILSMYSGTKRFDTTLSLAVNEEYKKCGVIIQSLQPGMVRTNMTYTEKGLKLSNWVFPTAPNFTSQMMKTAGKSTEVSGYWGHWIVRTIYNLMPEDTCSRMIRNNFQKIESD